MTKYILVGGYITKALDGGKAFCDELVKGIEQPVKVLDCMFARSPDLWEEVFSKDKDFFAEHIPGVSIELRLAQPETFLKQLAWADVVFFRGGYSDQLKAHLSKTPEWVTMIDGKTVAGTSAGADILAKYFLNLDTLVVGEGFGLVPIKTIPHFGSDYNSSSIDWGKEEIKLKSYGEQLPFVPLREGEFKVFHI